MGESESESESERVRVRVRECHSTAVRDCAILQVGGAILQIIPKMQYQHERERERD